MSLTVDLKTGMVGRSEVFVASLDTALTPDVSSVLDLSNLVMPAPGLSAEEMSRLASVDYALQGPVSESALRQIAWMFRMKEAEALVQQMGLARVGAEAVMGMWEKSLGLPAEVSSAQPSNSRALAA
jgi:hypothetical protein